jgi:hypothetical protein
MGVIFPEFLVEVIIQGFVAVCADVGGVDRYVELTFEPAKDPGDGLGDV